MSRHAGCSTELLVTDVTCKVPCLLMLVQDELVIEVAVTVVAERLHDFGFVLVLPSHIVSLAEVWVWVRVNLWSLHRRRIDNNKLQC